MRAYLVLHRTNAEGFGVIVNVHTKPLRKRIISLLSEDRKKEAIDLLVSKAMVESYVPADRQPAIKPELTLVEGSL